jgi:phosphoserine phosphatase RsbU/P
MYTEQDLRGAELVAAALALKLANSDLLAEQEQAARIQSSLLPRTLSTPSGYEVFARLEPCTKVAGDLYDVLPLRSGRLAILLGDVCGKGTGAALLMASVLAAFRAIAHQGDDVLNIVESLADGLGDCLDETNYVTLFASVLDPERHTLSYVNAGHGAALLLYADGTHDELETTGTPVGMRLGIPYRSRTVEIPKGSLLCTWSDGLHEAHRTDVQPICFFGQDRLVQSFVELRSLPLAEFAEAVFDQVDAFQGGTQAHDDRTLLLLRLKA